MNSDSSKSAFTPEHIQDLYNEHVAALTTFLVGILRDDATAADVLQTTFTKLLDKGHTIQQASSAKAWLFRVAFNEAMVVKRKTAMQQRHAEPIAWKVDLSAGADKGNDFRLSQPMHRVIQQETIDQVKTAIQELPENLQDIVKKRFYENLKFKDIAAELGIPLGTALARAQKAYKKLEPLLRQLNEDQ